MRRIGLAVVLAFALALTPTAAPAADASYSEDPMSFTSGVTFEQ